MAALTDVAIAQAMVANGRWSARLGWDRYVDAIDVLLGAAPGTPAAAAVFSSALADWQAAHQLDVDGILGPETWAAMRRALAPPDSLTGVVPATMPAVPNGFSEIIATFGDPRPLSLNRTGPSPRRTWRAGNGRSSQRVRSH